MRSIAVFVVVVLGLLGASPGGATAISGDEQRALEQVRLYSKAWMGGDIDAIVALTHPVFAARMGGDAKYRESLVKLFDQFRKLFDLSHGVERIGTPSEEAILGRSRMFGVPAIRNAPGAAPTPLVYVVVSYDEGNTWKIVALSCTDEAWLKALVPGYNGQPDVLGMANPAVRSAITEATFDEEVFLQGPRYGQSLPAANSVARGSGAPR